MTDEELKITEESTQSPPITYRLPVLDPTEVTTFVLLGNRVALRSNFTVDHARLSRADVASLREWLAEIEEYM